MIPSRLTSKPSSSISFIASLLLSGSKSSQTYFCANESKPPILRHMYASYPSGMPSPSVSDFLGSKYDLIPSPSTSPVNPLRKPGSVHSAGYGQQYSSVAFRPSLSLSRSASDASSLSKPFIEYPLPSTDVPFTHSANRFS